MIYKQLQVYNQEAIDWIEKQDNKTEYITNLILKDKKERENYITREEINTIVERIVIEILRKYTDQTINNIKLPIKTGKEFIG